MIRCEKCEMEGGNCGDPYHRTDIRNKLSEDVKLDNNRWLEGSPNFYVRGDVGMPSKG